MRISSVLFLALLATNTLRAQTLDKFYIGAFWVGGNTGDTVRQLNPGAVATYNERPNLPSDLPRGRFNELQDLGLNLAAIELHPDSIVRSDANGRMAQGAGENRYIEIEVSVQSTAGNVFAKR